MENNEITLLEEPATKKNIASKMKRNILTEKYKNHAHRRKILTEKILPRTTCLYFHINIQEQNIFYCGIGGYGRPYEKGKTERSKFWHIITTKYDYQVIIIETNLTWEEACEKEIYWIRRIGRRDLKEGTLVNLTDGGDGMHNLSQETRNRISKSKKGVRVPSRIIDLTGKVFGKLTVLNRTDNLKRRTAWLCDCECGTKNFIVAGEHLQDKDNGTMSCGCLNRTWLNEMDKKCFLQLKKGTEEILSAFDNIINASKLTNIEMAGLYKFFKGTQKHGGGYDWVAIPKEEYLLYEKYHNISGFKYISGKTDKKITAFLPDGTEKKFDSMLSAAKELGVFSSNIAKCLQGERKHSKNITFKEILD